MANARWSRLRNLFDEARELTGEERARLLDRELAGDAALRAELEALLRAGDEASHFLVDRAAPGTGSTIGPYHLIETIGEGGFGVVYLAEQERPIRRRVALKLIRPGMDSRQVIARFEAERQALALMDHPGIAQVFDAGETPEGRPYFAMEHVPGVPITVFCDGEKLSLRERLEVFLLACDAIRHAHQKGVIHRDIKPSNVMVARRDGAPALKVIDFGIAKATGENAPGGPTMTREGMIIGTTGYMSPEQLGATTAPVDTRSDIYSLGVLLYELLAGDLPYDRERLKKASWLDAMQIVLADPTPPAVRAAKTDTAEVATKRSTDARSLVKSLKGELEWITLKALEKEPERRYASVSELANDIRHFLADEPVSAAAPGTMYRIRKYARRHRVGVTAAALVLAAVVAGGIAAAVGFGRAVRAERVARHEAASSEQVADFLVSLFHASSPGESAGDSMTVRELLDEGTRRIEADTTGDAQVRARLIGAISDSYLNLGLFDEGIRLTRAALATVERAQPPDPVETARYIDKVINAYSMAARTDSIPPLIDRAIGLLASSPKGDDRLKSALWYRKARLAQDAGETTLADSLNDLAIATGEAVATPQPGMLTRMYAVRATLAGWRGDFPGAVAAYRVALDYAAAADEPMRTIGLKSRLANAYANMGKADSALVPAQEAVALAREIYAPDHRGLADALSSLSQVLSSLERYPEAIAAGEEAVAIVRAKPEQGEHLAYELGVLASLYAGADQYDLAVARGEEGAALTEAVHGHDHFRTAEALANLARYHQWADRPAPAESLFAAAVDIFDRIEDRTIVAPLARRDLALLLLDREQDREAELLLARAEAGIDSTNYGLRPYYGETMLGRARARARLGHHAEASRMAADAFRMRAEDLALDDESLIDPWLSWATVRLAVGDVDDAIAKLVAARKCGATPVEVARFPELAALRTRPDYPFDNSP
jgi:serine/threonine protein kinase/tetratricopeptide (TPR) repeat protein